MIYQPYRWHASQTPRAAGDAVLIEPNYQETERGLASAGRKYAQSAGFASDQYQFGEISRAVAAWLRPPGVTRS